MPSPHLLRSPQPVTAPTAERRKAYASQWDARRLPVDRGLETLFYQYSRYLMLSCSRPGEGAEAILTAEDFKTD